MNNYFTTLHLTKHLLSWKLTITSILKKNKPCNPTEMGYSLFDFHERNVALCLYVPQKNKAVIVLSTMHYDTAVNDNEKKNPHMITFYNKYKAGVDTMDQMK